MFAPYRSSMFVDFNTGLVHIDPVRFVERHVGPWDLEAEINFFQCRVDVWQLSPAIEILKQIESHDHPSAWSHSAYALLFILTPYFEMVGKIINKNSAIPGLLSATCPGSPILTAAASPVTLREEDGG